MAKLIYTIEDRSGDKSTTEREVPSLFDIPALSEFAVSFAEILNDFINGRIVSCELCFGVDISTLINNDIILNTDVESVGRFAFVTGAGNPVKMNLPGIDDTFSIDGTDDLDQADPAIAAVITMMENGIVTAGGAIAPSDIGEETITDLLYAREGTRASGSRR
ncbi:MAG: hypothetical protein WBC91_26510 [Phototrophicaceae bacterium]